MKGWSLWHFPERHATPTALIRRISDTLPIHFGQSSEPFRTAIRWGRKTVRQFAGSLSEFNRNSVRNESDYCPIKIGSLSEFLRNTQQPAGLLGRLEPGAEPVVLAQALALAQIGRAALMQAEQTGHPAQLEHGQQDVAAKTSVGHGQVAVLEPVQESPQQPLFTLVFVALGVIQEHAGGKAEDPQQAKERKATAGLLGTGLRVSALVGGGVGRADSRAVDDLGAQAMPELGHGFAGGSHADPQAAERVQGQALAGLTVGAGVFIDPARVVQTEQGLDLADDFATGGIGLEHLVEEAKEGAAHVIDAVAAVEPLLGLGEQTCGQERSQQEFQVAEAVLAQVLDAPAQGGQASAPGGEKRRMHNKYIYLSKLDGKGKMKA